MSKTIILLIITAIIGSAIGWFYGITILQTIQNFIGNPSSLFDTIKTVPQTIQQHWQTLLGVASGAGGMMVVASKAYSNYKEKRQQIEENLQTVNTQLSTKIAETQTGKEEAETTLATKQTEFTDTVSGLSGQVADLSNNNETLNTTIRQVTDERNLYSRQLKTAETELAEYKKKYPPLHVQ